MSLDSIRLPSLCSAPPRLHRPRCRHLTVFLFLLFISPYANNTKRQKDIKNYK